MRVRGMILLIGGWQSINPPRASGACGSAFDKMALRLNGIAGYSFTDGGE